ncbi:MAG: sigma-70 family RNA polymerase sigma factor [Bacillota bacterium]
MIENIQLWKEYKENSDKNARQKLIKNYLPLVKYQAGRVEMLVPDFIEKEDLESFGIIGLLDAIERFDHRRGIKFKTYASRRIRGEIIDHLRRLDWLPHSMRRQGKKLKKAAERLRDELGRRPTVEELSQEMDLPREKINELYHKLYSSQWISLYSEMGEGESVILDLIPDNTGKNPEKELDNSITVELLAEAIDNLGEKQKLVISLYYYEELTQVEIAEVMNLSEARISQIHQKAVYRLRGYLSHKKGQLV